MPALLLLGIVKCVAIAKRETVSSMCAYALLTVLLSWALSAVLVASQGAFNSDQPSRIAAGASLCALSAAGMLVGIVGLVNYDAKRYTQGRIQAVLAIILGLILPCGFTVALIMTVELPAVRRRLPPPPPISSAATPSASASRKPTYCPVRRSRRLRSPFCAQ
jgi:hypothetical protein